ncbi:MAG: hypothetical protein JEZ14_09450 [Marinilabiliaceae bacterium]|nr:hypothetical protein [Marinilabiliaceae bacterium]
MDILTIALSGVAASTVIASFTKGNIRSRSATIVSGCIGANGCGDFRYQKEKPSLINNAQ